MKPLISTLIPLILIFQGLETSGATFKSGDKQTISTAIDEDTYIAAGEIHINARIGGDLVCTGGQIEINDTIEEDLTIAGGDIMINGTVNDDIRAAGGTLDIMQSVGGDLIIFGGEINVHESAVINGDVVVFGGEIDIAGEIKGELKVYGGEIDFSGTVNGMLTIKGGEININGIVQGNSFLSAEEIVIGRDCRFYKDVEYWSGDGEISFNNALENGSEAIFNPALKHAEKKAAPFILFGLGITFMLLYGVAILILLIIFQLLLKPVFVHSANYWKSDYVRSFGVGVLYIIGTPIAAVILIALVIGIPVGLFVLVNYGFTMFFSHLFAALIITNLLKEKYSPDWNNIIVILIAFVITLIIKFIAFIPIAGWLFAFIVSALALGSIILFIRDKLSK